MVHPCNMCLRARLVVVEERIIENNDVEVKIDNRFSTLFVCLCLNYVNT